MALLPPRKYATPTRLAKQQLTPLQAIIKLGIPQHRAEKALAAVGNNNLQLACDWLINHVNDTSLDENEPREYVLYACPTGHFKENLEAFWSESKAKCGWNGAHNCMPHITLVSFFKAPDECEPELADTLKRVVDSAGAYLNRPLDVELFSNDNFMGLFVTENDANFLKRIALQYVKEVSSSIISETYEQLDALVACFPWCGGVASNTRCIPRSSRSISLEPHVKSLHLTLAYRFDPADTETLKALIENSVDINSASTYELRLYSRDPRVASKQVFKVVQPFNSHEADELELQIGDMICVSEEALKSSTDGWVEGFSCSTGEMGLLPLSLVCQIPESDTWTLHCKIQVCNPTPVSSNSATAINSMVPSTKDNHVNVLANGADNSGINTDAGNGNAQQQTNRTDANRPKTQEEINADNLHEYIARIIIRDTDKNVPINAPTKNQKLFVLRHGERVDFTFANWTKNCFLPDGEYKRLDLNLPKSLPKRNAPLSAWQNDSPLTMIGVHQARLTGDMMRDINVDIGVAYTSPSYRAIQTCHALLEGLNLHRTVKMRIEPGLFEWCGWYPGPIPEFCTSDNLVEFGLNVDTDYVPLVSVAELSTKHKNESIAEFYRRNHDVTESATKNSTDNILLVGHASNIDTNTRLLCGRRALTKAEMNELMHGVPYACMLMAERNESNEWNIVPSCVYPISHNKNPHFDWSRIANFDPDVSPSPNAN